MQDYPKALPADARVGFTVINQVGGEGVRGCVDWAALGYVCCPLTHITPSFPYIRSPNTRHHNTTTHNTTTPQHSTPQHHNTAPPHHPTPRTHPPQVWATYSPVKNSAADARAKAAEGNPTHSATVAEMDLYKCNAEMLQMLAGE